MALQDVVARYEANLDADGNVLDFDQVALDLEAAIAADMAEIEALQATIVRLEGLNVNAEGVREELTQVENRIDELNSEINDANLALDRANLAIEPFEIYEAEVNNKLYWIGYNQDRIELYQTVIESLEADLDEANERIEPYVADIADVQTTLEAEYQTLLSLTDATEEAWYELKYAEFNGTADEIAEAQATYDAAKQDIIDYTGDYHGTPQSQWEFNPNTNTWEVVGFTYNSRIWLYSNPVPGTEYGDAIIALNDFASNETYKGLLTRINSLTNSLSFYNNSVINLNNNITTDQIRLSEIYANLEVSSAEEYYTTLNELSMDRAAKEEARNEIQSQLNALWNLRWNLFWYLNDPNRSVAYIENQISNYQSQIATLEANIEANQDLLSQNAFETEEMAAMILRTQEKIDRLMTEYDALVALANEYLEKFNEILENN